VGFRNLLKFSHLEKVLGFIPATRCFGQCVGSIRFVLAERSLWNYNKEIGGLVTEVRPR
jgi:hypothetical protein